MCECSRDVNGDQEEVNNRRVRLWGTESSTAIKSSPHFDLDDENEMRKKVIIMK